MFPVFLLLFRLFFNFIFQLERHPALPARRTGPTMAAAHAQIPQQDELQQRKARRFTQLFFMKRFSQTRAFENHFNRLVKRISASFSLAAPDIKSRRNISFLSLNDYLAQRFPALPAAAEQRRRAKKFRA
jgi:hypothetical protein